MKKNTVLFSVLLFLIPLKSVFSQGYKITVEIEGAKDSIMLLVNYFGDKKYIKDTVEHQGDGVYIFKGEKKLPQGIYLAVRQDKKRSFELLVTDDQKFTMKTTDQNMISDMEIKGSKENKLFYNFLEFSNPKNKKVKKLQKKKKKLGKSDTSKRNKLQAKIDKLNKEINDYKKKFIEKHPETLMAEIYKASRAPEVPDTPDNLSQQEQKEWEYRYFVKHYFDNLDLNNEKLLHTPVLHQRVSNFINNVVVQEPDSVIKACDRLLAMAEGNKEIKKYLLWYLTSNAERSDIMGMDEVFVHMVDKHYSKENTPWVSNKMMKNVKKRANKLRNLLIGKKAPNMLLTDTTGDPIPIHTVEAKYLVVYFWEPDCGYCKRETPKLKKLYDDMKDKGLKVYAVCIKRKNTDKMRNYINKHNLDWINVYDKRRMTNFHRLYDLISTPTIYLLDENKKILAKRINVSQLRDFLERKMDKEQKGNESNAD